MIKRLIAGTVGWTVFMWAGVALAATLTWVDNSTNEASFRVERKPPGGAFGELAFTAANVVTYVDLTPPVGACYRVRARNAAGDSPYSNEACLLAPPAAPGNLIVVP